MKKKITFSNSGVSNIKKAEEDIALKALEQLFLNIGVTPSESGNTYSLNGVEEIEREDMCIIFCQKEIIDKLDEWEVARGSNARTIVPCKQRCGVRLKNRPLKGYYSFAESKIEVLKFGADQTLDTSKEGELLPVENLDGTFYRCGSLRIVYPMNLSGVTTIGHNTFEGCSALNEVRLFDPECSLNLASSPRLSYASLLYLIENKKNDTSIRVAVAPHTYKYMIALREPDETVGGTADGWNALSQKALERGIVFHTPATIARTADTTLKIDKGGVADACLTIDDSYCCVQNGVLTFP